jgi:hypothetical protein
MHTLGALRRRWYVALPLVLLTVTAALFVRGGVQPGYTVTASAVVLPPNSTDADTSSASTNPLVNLPTATQAKALSIIATGPEFRSRITGGETLAAYSVTPQARDPFLTISIESRDPRLAVSVGERVIEELQGELDRQQPGIPTEQRVSLGRLVPPSVVAVDDAQLRALVVSLAVGLLDVRSRHGAPGEARSPDTEGKRGLRRSRSPAPDASPHSSPHSREDKAEPALSNEDPPRISEPTRP